MNTDSVIGRSSAMSWSRAVWLPMVPNVATAMPYFLTGTLAVRLRADLGISEAGLGGLFAMFALGSTVSSPMMGRLAERAGAGPSLKTACAAAGVVMIAIALSAHAWLQFALLMVVAGVAAAFVQSASNLWLLRTVRDHRIGLAFGLKQSAGPAAAMLAGLAVPAIAVFLGWRWAYAGFGVLAVLGALSMPHRGLRGHRRTTRGRGGDVALGPLVVIAIGFAISTSVSAAFIGFTVTGAVDQAGMSESAAGVLFSTSAIGGILARVGLGVVADRGWGGPFGISATLVGMGSLGLMLLATGTTVAYLIAVPFAFVTAWGWSGVLHQAVTQANPGAPATATGIIQSGASVGLFAGPVAFGLIAVRSYEIAWTAAACASLVGCASLLVGRHLMRRHAERALI